LKPQELKVGSVQVSKALGRIRETIVEKTKTFPPKLIHMYVDSWCEQPKQAPKRAPLSGINVMIIILVEFAKFSAKKWSTFLIVIMLS
jgi:hypothetical protein